MINAIQNKKHFECSQVHTIAVCIKVILRQNLTQLVLLSADDLRQKTMDGVWKVVLGLGNDLILWIVDLMASVALNEHINGMGPRSVATAFAPNVYVLEDSYKVLMNMADVVEFLCLAVKYRLGHL